VHMLIRLNGNFEEERRQLRLELELAKWTLGFGVCRLKPATYIGNLPGYLVKCVGNGDVKRAISYSQNIEREPWWTLRVTDNDKITGIFPASQRIGTVIH
jgi:hypothetical protein